MQSSLPSQLTQLVLDQPHHCPVPLLRTAPSLAAAYAAPDCAVPGSAALALRHPVVCSVPNLLIAAADPAHPAVCSVSSLLDSVDLLPVGHPAACSELGQLEADLGLGHH